MLVGKHLSVPVARRSMAAAEQACHQRAWIETSARELVPFAAVVVQFGLIVLVVESWQLENLLVSRLLELAFVGFIIHHLIPLRFRLAFFAILSLAAVLFGAGEVGSRTFVAGLTGRVPLRDFVYSLAPGIVVVAIGLGLIGLCHLPIRFRTRFGLIAAVGAGLAFLRVNIHWIPDLADIWVILGSMFM